MTDLTPASTAREMAAAVRERQVSARELLELHLARIEERNPELNAIVSLDAERAMKGAWAADDHLARGGVLGPLHGLPFAVKDTHAVAGWRTTYGSPLFAEHVPDTDDLIVERVRRAGVVLIGKTNVPEFAAGSHTFNTVFGTTRNPVDPSRSAGGSSGGAAAALARRHGAARRRQRHGRLPAQPRLVLRGGRTPSVARPGPRVAAAQPVGDHVGRRPAGPQRRRPGPAAVRARRTRPRARRRPWATPGRRSPRRSPAPCAASGSRGPWTSAGPSRSTARWPG